MVASLRDDGNKAAGNFPAANVRHVILSEAKDLKLRHCEERSDVAIYHCFVILSVSEESITDVSLCST